jgi:alginate O-acetyltransferase complex protein AlgI
MFIPTFPAGPLETYQGFYEKRSYSFDRQLFYKGLRRIALGYFKKVFVVDFVFAIFFTKIITTVGNPDFHASQLGPWWPLAYCILVLVRAYFDLSAYTDLAIGFSALFGFRIMENFHLPFLSKNLGDFWRRWHISLSTWCRNNVYFPGACTTARGSSWSRAGNAGRRSARKPARRPANRPRRPTRST